jgi:ubiquinone/menaquinone biosynthesis C-methylase UbiE
MAAHDTAPSSTDLQHPLFGRFYAGVSRWMEAQGMAELRTELLAGLTGRVVEIGAGNGRNFAHYPSTVTEVLAVEPEPYLRTLAARAATAAPIPVTVVAGRAEQLPLPDHSADAVVLCLVLCSLPDRRAALADAGRVLRANGTLRFLEHTIAATPGLRVVQRVADATVWPRLAAGCRTATDPAAAIREAGLEIVQLRPVRFPVARWFTQPGSPHVLGRATKPG